MYSIGSNSVYSIRWQCAIILLAATRKERGIEKNKVLDKIQQNKWFDFRMDDYLPYPSQRVVPRWVTLMSLTHEDCTKQGLWESGGRDWMPTIKGENFFVHVCQAIVEKKIDVRKCFLWSSGFKSFLDTTYIPGPQDAHRLLFMYDDDAKRFVKRFTRSRK